MKNVKRRTQTRRDYVMAALIAGIVGTITLPAMAGANQFRDFTANTAVVSLEAKRIEQVRTMETARIAFVKATLAGGEQAAPYEYYMAQEYLALAEEEFRAGDKIGVDQFAAESNKYASIALKMAEGGLP